MNGVPGARERIDIFPYIGDDQYEVLDSEGRYSERRAAALEKLRADPRYQLVFEKEGVLVFKRVP